MFLGLAQAIVEIYFFFSMKHLVLLGAGRAHLQVLQSLVALSLPGVHVTLVTPLPRLVFSELLSSFVAGHQPPVNCSISLAPLLDASGTTWLVRSAVTLEVQSRCLSLDDGSSLTYDVLSIDLPAMLDRQMVEQAMPGAREHALFVRPAETFFTLWPQVVTLAQKRPLRMTVIGGGRPDVELALAVVYRLPDSSVTLLTGDESAGCGYPPALQKHVMQALKQHRITVIQERCTGIADGEVTLASGARLACDVPIIATRADAPTWLRASGLALDDQGFITVDGFQRVISHREVFAAGSVSRRADMTHLASGTDTSFDVGPALAKNLRSVLAGIDPTESMYKDKFIDFLSLGEKRVIANWGNWTAQGYLVWWLKERRDREVLKKYSKYGQSGPAELAGRRAP